MTYARSSAAGRGCGATGSPSAVNTSSSTVSDPGREVAGDGQGGGLGQRDPGLGAGSDHLEASSRVLRVERHVCAARLQTPRIAAATAGSGAAAGPPGPAGETGGMERPRDPVRPPVQLGVVEVTATVADRDGLRGSPNVLGEPPQHRRVVRHGLAGVSGERRPLDRAHHVRFPRAVHDGPEERVVVLQQMCGRGLLEQLRTELGSQERSVRGDVESDADVELGRPDLHVDLGEREAGQLGEREREVLNGQCGLEQRGAAQLPFVRRCVHDLLERHRLPRERGQRRRACSVHQLGEHKVPATGRPVPVAC